MAYTKLPWGGKLTYVNLSSKSGGFYSLAMGFCDTAVVLWGNGPTRPGRGCHVGGGLGAIDWPTLFKGVSEDSSPTIILVPGSFRLQDRYTSNRGVNALMEALDDKECTVIEYMPSTSVVIERNGLVHRVGLTDPPDSLGIPLLPRWTHQPPATWKPWPKPQLLE